MHDLALWTSWYVVLLLFPLMVLFLMARDMFSRRGQSVSKRTAQREQ